MLKEKIEKEILNNNNSSTCNPEIAKGIGWALKWVLEELNKMTCENCSKKDKKTIGNPEGCSIYIKCKRYGLNYCSEWEKK